MRIREAQKHMDPTDPNPQHWPEENLCTCDGADDVLCKLERAGAGEGGGDDGPVTGTQALHHLLQHSSPPLLIHHSHLNNKNKTIYFPVIGWACKV
jgi:hypothetical protein